MNCQGVIDHTPNTNQCIKEFHRILKPGGTASVSVYYKNILLKAWPYLSLVGKVLENLGGGMKGRGRDKIFSEKNPDEIVRIYDGIENPIGKSYSKGEFVLMLEPYFQIEEVCFK